MIEPLDAKFSKLLSTYESHTAQIPRLKIIIDQVDMAITMLTPKVETLPFFLKANIDFNLYALSDLNKSLVRLLEDNRSCTVEAISRVASEQAANLIYVIGGNSDERAKSLISHYVVEAMRKARLWLKYSEAHKHNGPTQSAKQKLNYLQYWREQIDASHSFKSVKPWPSAADRFRDIGAEEFYRTIFASSSDAIHGFPDDIFHSTTLSYLPEEIHKNAFNAYVAEKHSFAVFLATCAIGLYVEAIHSLALKLDIQNIAEGLRDLADLLNLMIATHESDHKSMDSMMKTNVLDQAD